MSTNTTANQQSKSDYINQILDKLGIDPDTVENADEFQSVSLAEAKAFYMGLQRDEPLSANQDKIIPIPKEKLEEQLERLNQALRDGGIDAVAEVEDVHPMVMDMYLEEAQELQVGTIAEEIAANSDEYDNAEGVREDFPTEKALRTKWESMNPGASANYAAQRGARARPSSDSDSFPSPIASRRVEEIAANEDAGEDDDDSFPSPVAGQRAKQLEGDD